jgi:MFS family permease
MSQPRDPEPYLRLPRGLAPLGYRNFALYWSGFTATVTGRWIETTGAVWIAYELSGDPVLLGLLGVVRAVPNLLITPFAGVIADRFDQRRLVFLTQLSGLITSLSLGILILAGTLELWHLYLQVAVQSSVSAVDVTTRQAFFPRLVPRAHIVESVTLVSAAIRGSGLIGPAIGGIAIAALGDASPFLLSAATFLFLVAALASMRDVTSRPIAAATSIRADLAEGLRYVRRAPVISGLLQLETVFSIFQVNPVVVTIIAADVLGVGPEGLGALLSAIALGALAGTGALIVFGSTNQPGRFATLATIGYGGAMIGFAVTREFALAFLSLTLVGVLDACLSITRNAIMQLAAPPTMRGRVMAYQGTVLRGVGPLAQTQSGWVAGLVGGPTAVVVAAIGLAGSAALVARRTRRLWAFSRRDAEQSWEGGGGSAPEQAAAGDEPDAGREGLEAGRGGLEARREGLEPGREGLEAGREGPRARSGETPAL